MVTLFRFVRSIKRDGRDVEGSRCMRGKDGKLNFSEKDRGRVWKEHMERIMNEENEWDQMVETSVVEGPVECVSKEEVVKAIKDMKTGKAAGPSDVSVELIAASGELGVNVMRELCQGILEGKEMPEDWALSTVVPIFVLRVCIHTRT